MQSQSRQLSRQILIALLLAGAVVRWFAFPYRYYYSDVDEYDYLYGGAAVLEGLPPTLHYAFAGPETWFSWTYSAALSARYMLLPTAEERAVPMKVRPYFAVNHALFDIAYDITLLRMLYIAVAMLVSLAAIAAGYSYGLRRGGLAGGVLLGGLAAFLPVLLEHSAKAKPYSMAWSCATVAFYFAAAAEMRPRRWIASAIFLGLAISSRVEMIALLPLLILAELWTRRASMRGFVIEAIRYTLLTIATVMLVSPWSYTNLLGNLRAIATIRFNPIETAHSGLRQSLLALFATEAIGIPIVIMLAASALALWRREDARTARWPWPAAVWVLLMLATMASATGFGLRHQGPAFMSLLLFAPFAASIIAREFPKSTWAAIALALALAIFGSIRVIGEYRAGYFPDDSTAWVNAHVPAGTILYMNRTYRDPLPTPASANAIWDEVMSREAARRKFESGLARLNLGEASMPPALSEQSMATERGNARHYYILGSRAERVGPRYDLRRYHSSAVFGIPTGQSPLPAFLKTGGVMIWRGDGPLEGAGAPVKQWTNPSGAGTYVYVRPMSGSD